MSLVRTVLGIALLVAGAASGGGPAVPVTRLAIQLNWVPEPEFGGIYEAQRAGLFAANGLEVTILKGGPDVPAVQMTAAGRVELGVAAADEVVSLREKGADVVALFATYQTSPQGIMVKSSRLVKDIPSLLASGGTLVAQPGLAYLKYLDARYGLGKMKIVPYGSGAMAQFLDPSRANVAMQCFITAEPLAARREGVEPKVFLIADTGFDPYATVIITRGGFLRAHRDVCRRFVAALREGWRRYLDDPVPANRVMALQNSAMDLSTFTAAAAAQEPLIESAGGRLGVMSLERWQTLAKQLLDLHVIDAPVDAGSCFANL